MNVKFQKIVPKLFTGPDWIVAMAPVGCVPARALTPLPVVTAAHTLTC